MGAYEYVRDDPDYLALAELARGPQFNLRQFGLRGQFDSSSVFDKAVRSVVDEGGGSVEIPHGIYYTHFQLASGVRFIGSPGLTVPGQPSPVKLRAGDTDPVIDTPSDTELIGCGLIGMEIFGSGGTSGIGVRLRKVRKATFRDLTISRFGDQGLVTESPTRSITFENLFLQNCLLNRDRDAREGALDIDGTDHTFYGFIEVTTSQTALTSSDLLCAAIALRGSNIRSMGLVGEKSDIGIWVPGNWNPITLARADLNFGPGWVIDGNDNPISTSQSMRNSQDSDGTYSGWVLNGDRNAVAAVIGTNLLADSNHQKYGFEDNGSDNTILAYTGTGNRTALTNWAV